MFDWIKRMFGRKNEENNMLMEEQPSPTPSPQEEMGQDTPPIETDKMPETSPEIDTGDIDMD